jgi:hypothetical protein
MVHPNTTTIILESSSDRSAITTERIESQSHGQVFLHINGEDGDAYVKTMGKTVYQLPSLFFQKQFDHFHTRMIPSFRYKNKRIKDMKTKRYGKVLVFLRKRSLTFRETKSILILK